MVNESGTSPGLSVGVAAIGRPPVTCSRCFTRLVVFRCYGDAARRPKSARVLGAGRSGSRVSAAVGIHGALHATGFPARLPLRLWVAVPAMPLLTQLTGIVGRTVRVAVSCHVESPCGGWAFSRQGVSRLC